MRGRYEREGAGDYMIKRIAPNRGRAVATTAVVVERGPCTGRLLTCWEPLTYRKRIASDWGPTAVVVVVVERLWWS